MLQFKKKLVNKTPKILAKNECLSGLNNKVQRQISNMKTCDEVVIIRTKFEVAEKVYYR